MKSAFITGANRGLGLDFIEVTKEFVRIVDGHELKAIIIENPRAVEAMGQIFKLAKEKYKN